MNRLLLSLLLPGLQEIGKGCLIYRNRKSSAVESPPRRSKALIIGNPKLRVHVYREFQRGELAGANLDIMQLSRVS